MPNILPATILKSFVTGFFYFSEEEHKQILEVQIKWIHSLNTSRERDFNPDKIVS